MIEGGFFSHREASAARRGRRGRKGEEIDGVLRGGDNGPHGGTSGNHAKKGKKKDAKTRNLEKRYSHKVGKKCRKKVKSQQRDQAPARITCRKGKKARALVGNHQETS